MLIIIILSATFKTYDINMLPQVYEMNISVHLKPFLAIIKVWVTCGLSEELEIISQHD